MTAAADSGADIPIVAIDGVSKSFGGFTALQRIDLDITRGEFFSLLGPSGCGKTTLLRIIGGFEDASTGDIRINGRSVRDVPAFQRATNMIFQHLALFPHMNVSDNVAFGLKMKRMDRAAIAQKVAAALAQVRLEDFALRPVDQLSGGQRQRVAMARALVNDPDVLLLDEPLGALDLQLRLHMQEELRRLQKSLGNTFIFVTHDQEEAMRMSDRIAVMEGGRIRQLGTPEEIYELPRSRFVASFIGHANLLPARVLGKGDAGLVMAESDGMRLACRTHPDTPSLKVGTVAVRYEKVGLRPATAGDAAAADDIAMGRVMERIYFGSAVRFSVACANGLSLTAQVADVERARGIAEGDEVILSCAPGAAAMVEDD